MVYAPYGPWADGSSPGVAAEFLNPLEAYLQTINSAATDSGISASAGILTMLGLVNNDAGVTVTGTTNGSATVYQFLRGNLKAIYVSFNLYRNSTTTEQRITLPQAFIRHALVLAPGGSPPIHFWNGGSSVSGKLSIITGFPSPPGAGVPATGQSIINGFSMGDITSAFDQIGCGISLGLNYTAGVLIIGI